jgi:hypothetical protein
MERMNPEQLEKMVHSALRALPDRRAPATLEARVRAAIERRAAIPWWHQSWSHWPQWARAAFLGFCGGLAGLLVFAGIYAQAGFDSAQFQGAVGPALAVVDRLWNIGRSVAGLITLVVRHLPAWWLYGAIAFVAGLYAMLFGLAATAYRTLWTPR